MTQGSLAQPSELATARFGLVTLAKLEEAPAVRILHEYLPKWTDA